MAVYWHPETLVYSCAELVALEAGSWIQFKYWSLVAISEDPTVSAVNPEKGMSCF